MEYEILIKTERSVSVRMAGAKFPAMMTLDKFDFSSQSNLSVFFMELEGCTRSSKSLR